MAIPLGKEVAQPTRYDPSVLAAVPRSQGRKLAHIRAEAFGGWDDWTAYELCWPDLQGKRHTAVLAFRVPANSPNLVESKSIKLYLNSCFFSPFKSENELLQEVGKQLSNCAGAPVNVRLDASPAVFPEPGADWIDLDQLEASQGELVAAAETSDQFYLTRAFRSLCPVTGQPDWASVFVRCEGPRLNPNSLCHYLYRFSEHSGFHEQCVEQILQYLLEHGQDRVAVCGRFLRRGGIDINPFRTTDVDFSIGVGRLPRQ